MPKVPRERRAKYATGYYILCPFSDSRHKQPLAVPIQRGDKSYFARCISCGSMLFFGKSLNWSDQSGLSPQDCARMGAQILALP